MPSVRVLDIFVASLKATVSVGIILCIGIVLVHRKIVQRHDVHTLSKLIAGIFLASLVFVGFGKALTLEMMQQLWPLIAVGVILPTTYGSVAYVVGKLCKVEAWFHRWFVAMCMFSNTVALVFVIIEVLCSSIPFKVPAPPDAVSVEAATGIANASIPEAALFVTLAPGACIATAEAYVFLYGLTVPFLIWVPLFKFVQGSPPVPHDLAHKPRPDATVDAPTNSDVEDGLDEAHENDQDCVELTLEDGNPTAQSAPPPDSPPARHRSASSKSIVSRASSSPTKSPLLRNFVTVLIRPPVLASFIGITVGLVPALKRQFFHPSGVLSPFGSAAGVLSDAAVPISNVVVGCSLGLFMAASNYRLNPKSIGIRWRTLILAVAMKMVFLPAIGFGVVYGFSSLLPDLPLLRTILYIETAPPSANMVVVLANFLQHNHCAKVITLIMVWQYIVAIPALTGYTTLALHLSGV